MKRNRFIVSGFLVWLIQLTVADYFMIDTVRPDFIGILIMYWAVKYGRFLGTISGLVFGLIFDFSGSALFFGLSPLIYSFTGYLSGNLKGIYSKINPLYFHFFWVSIFLLHFFIFCTVNYQEILIIDLELFLGKWFGTSIYTIAIMLILQFIYPLNRID
tara:strand:+ start:1348 stop:1824 length:477 start_codon:yes stop_codon:yes gene_type:complete